MHLQHKASPAPKNLAAEKRDFARILEDRQIAKEIPYQRKMDKKLAQKFAESISLDDVREKGNLEWGWKQTPMLSIDLSSLGYGIVHIKDESRNPTGTFKDRAMWEIAKQFKYFGELYPLNGKSAPHAPVPRFSVITSGNVGASLSHLFEKYGLPPVKLLVSKSLSKEKLDSLKKMYADIYLVDLGIKQLSAREISLLTNNRGGIDITSAVYFEPHAIFYDWLVHEVFNQKPDEIYVPYGSGRLMENFLTWQVRSVKNHFDKTPDPRLQIPLGNLVKIGIFGAEPLDANSSADKLTKDFNPFTIFKDNDLSSLVSLHNSGKSTGVYKVKEEFISIAHSILSRHCRTEPSGAAGLALYLQRYEKQKPNPNSKVVIVNTGQGI